MKAIMSKSFEQSCKHLKVNPATVLPDVSNMPADMQDSVKAYAEMMINAKAINGDWVPKKGQPVWYLWVEWDYDEEGKPVGFRFWHADYVYGHAFAPGGSALFQTREKAEHAGRTFVETLKRMMPPNFNK